MSICFSLAQAPLIMPHLQLVALGEFSLAKGKSFDASGDASKGAVWKAGAKGLEPLLHPSLKSKGVLFLTEMHFGLYPRYGSEDYKTYEGMLNGQRYAIAFKLEQDGGLNALRGWVPFLVQKIAEFSAVKSNIGKQVTKPVPIAPVPALNASNDFYQNEGQGPANNGFYATPAKPMQGSGSIAIGKQQPPATTVGPVFIIDPGV